MQPKILIAGGGIGGLAAAIAAREAGCTASVLEKVANLAEVGAGIQLGPNATRHLQRWQLLPALQAVASYPKQVVVRSALNGKVLASMPLGDDFMHRYGAPYVTLHRADLHNLLFNAAQTRGCDVYFDHRVVQVEQLPDGVHAHVNSAECLSLHAAEPAGRAQAHAHSRVIKADILIGADGLWSPTRVLVPSAKPPVFMGHIAYRMLVDQSHLVSSMRLSDVLVWMGPRLHVVMYPVRAGQALNMVLIRHSAESFTTAGATDPQPHLRPAPTWLGVAAASDVTAAVGGTCSALQDIVQAMLTHSTQVGCWPLYASDALQSAQEMVHGRIALLGDAAHPMLPYLAQGAGMAIEDAVELERSLLLPHLDAPSRLQHYAQQRYKRNAAVQARAQRNGRIFHLRGLPALARNTALRWMGARIMDMPWLYAGGPCLR